MKHNFGKSIPLIFLIVILPAGSLRSEYRQVSDDNLGRRNECLNSDSIFLQYARNGFSCVVSDLYCYYDEVFFELPAGKQKKELEKMGEYADRYNNEALKRERHFISVILLPEDSLPDLTKKIESLNLIVDDAGKNNDKIMKLRALKAVFNLCWEKKEYAMAFQQALMLEKELQNVSEEEYPEKEMAYYEIGEAYFFFHDYDRAIPYLRRAVRPPKYFFDASSIQAQNTLGTYYVLREKLDSADFYFRGAYFSPGKVEDRSTLDAISLSNIGYVFLLNKEYDIAIEYMEPTLDYLLTIGKYENASEIALRLADCFMEKDDLKRSKGFIDSAEVYINRSGQEDIMRSLYTIKGRYYARTGNSKLSGAFMDSAFVANRRYENKYNRLNILRAEQKILEAEAKAKDEELRLKDINYQNVLFYLYCLIGIILMIIVCGIAIYLKGRSKNRQPVNIDPVLNNEENANAIQKPVIVEEGAEQANEIGVTSREADQNGEEPTEEDLALMEKVRILIEEDEIYKDLDLTLDMLAKNLNVNRNYLSKAINKITGKNFNTYINEYRVKEAIKILSDKRSDVISIDAIALEVGFNNRISFYQAFKKLTGLSPSEFRNNKNSASDVNN